MRVISCDLHIGIKAVYSPELMRGSISLIALTLFEPTRAVIGNVRLLGVDDWGDTPGSNLSFLLHDCVLHPSLHAVENQRPDPRSLPELRPLGE
jgi:hypothetical protein